MEGLRLEKESGSPPLVRERHPAQPVERQREGITPARAGKTTVSDVCSVFSWDHPRSCGKDKTGDKFQALAGGSPPLVRERQAIRRVVAPELRITPARAGKTIDELLEWRDGRDHPRSCGKDIFRS